MSQFDKYIKIAQEMINEEVNTDKMVEELEKMKDKLGFYDENDGVDNLQLGFDDNDDDKNFYFDVDLSDVLKNSQLIKQSRGFALKLTKKYDFNIADAGLDVLKKGHKIPLDSNLVNKLKDEVGD